MAGLGESCGVVRCGFGRNGTICDYCGINLCRLKKSKTLNGNYKKCAVFLLSLLTKTTIHFILLLVFIDKIKVKCHFGIINYNKI